jgi:hypothetical protein
VLNIAYSYILTRFSDIAIYGFSLNNSDILALIGYGTGKTKYETLYNTAVGAIIITIFVSFPWFTILAALTSLPRVSLATLLASSCLTYLVSKVMASRKQSLTRLV